MIPYGRQKIDKEDIASVLNVLRSDFITQGPAVPAFEKSVSDYCGAKHAVAVNSATSALHIACLALDVGPGDWVWTSPITFVASANCALFCGANVDFIDIDPDTNNLSGRALEEKLEHAEKNGTLPKVVIAVHFAGQSCDMEKIYALSLKYGFGIIEDASHGLGGRYKNIKIGSCKYSDISVFSFHPVKIITTGEGGVALTNNLDLAKRMARLRSHGVTRHPSEMSKSPDGPWYYEQIELGYNFRMTDIQAALGLSQMKKLDEFVKERHRIAARYNKILGSTELKLPWQHPDTYSAFHLYVIRVPSTNSPLKHLNVFETMRSQGIGVNLHYIPLYRQPFYEKMGFDRTKYPNAENYYSEAISLPIYPGLSLEEQNTVIEALLSPSGYQTIF